MLSQSGEVMLTLPYTMDGATAASQLGTAIGLAPTPMTVEASDCVLAGTDYQWGSFVITAPAAAASEPSALFSIRAIEPATSNGVLLEVAPQIGVGATIDQLRGAVPELLDTWPGSYLVDPTPDGEYGVVTNVLGGSGSGGAALIGNFNAPRFYNPHNGC